MAVAVVEPADVLDQAEAAHLGSGAFEHASGHSVLTCAPGQVDNYTVAPLEGEEDHGAGVLVTPVSRKQNSGQIIEILRLSQVGQAGVDLCQHSHPITPPVTL